MPASESEPVPWTQGSPLFATTRWSVVLTAAESNAAGAAQALDQLCRAYWYPLYAYVRRRGYSAEDAQDLTQSYFANLIAKGYLARADCDRGRFRTFLLTSVGNFLNNEWDRASAQKRGGGQRAISWDELDAEGRYVKESVVELTPERIFEKRWATTLLERVLSEMREEFLVSGRAELFEAIKPHLWSEGPTTSYSQLAVQLDMTVVAVKVTVHRLRHRYRDLLRAEIAHTVASPDDVDDEIRHLINVMTE